MNKIMSKKSIFIVGIFVFCVNFCATFVEAKVLDTAETIVFEEYSSVKLVTVEDCAVTVECAPVDVTIRDIYGEVLKIERLAKGVYQISKMSKSKLVRDLHTSLIITPENKPLHMAEQFEIQIKKVIVKKVPDIFDESRNVQKVSTGTKKVLKKKRSYKSRKSVIAKSKRLRRSHARYSPKLKNLKSNLSTTKSRKNRKYNKKKESFQKVIAKGLSNQQSNTQQDAIVNAKTTKSQSVDETIDGYKYDSLNLVNNQYQVDVEQFYFWNVVFPILLFITVVISCWAWNSYLGEMNFSVEWQLVPAIFILSLTAGFFHDEVPIENWSIQIHKVLFGVSLIIFALFSVRIFSFHRIYLKQKEKNFDNTVFLELQKDSVYGILFLRSELYVRQKFKKFFGLFIKNEDFGEPKKRLSYQ